MLTSEIKLAENNCRVLIAVLDGLKLIRENGGYGRLTMEIRDGLVPFVLKEIRENTEPKVKTYLA